MRNWTILTIMLLLPLMAAPIIGSRYGAIEIPATARAEEMQTTQTTTAIPTGFTIFQRQQVLPKYITITDATGNMEFLNPGPVPAYPRTFGVKLCYSAPFNLNSAYDNERLEVWQDAAGTATVQDITTVCPQFTR